jgi:lysophospholipase L1-like esterase
MSKSVQHLREGFGDTPILLISAHDRSIKLEGSYRTSPDIPILVNTQGEIAIENGCAFWNLFAAMGGYNSMVNYVHSNPPLAQKDHTHFNRTGANHIADLLFDTLMDQQ